MSPKKMLQDEPVPRYSGTDRLSALKIHRTLRTNLVGRTIYLFDQLKSTNHTALRIAQRFDRPPFGPSEGALILAESQSQGRGRLGRSWISPPRVNLYSSFIFRPRISVPQVPVVNCLAAASVVRAVQGMYGIVPEIKWPNDILLRGKKVAGILTELGTAGDRVDHVVVGIGLNVNLEAASLSPVIRESATSLKIETGQGMDRNDLMASVCNQLEERYLRFLKDGAVPVLEEFRTLTATLGRRVKVILPGRVLEGWAEDLDCDGALILRCSATAREIIHSGEVIHLRNGES